MPSANRWRKFDGLAITTVVFGGSGTPGPKLLCGLPRFPTRQLMRETVFEYIEVDYNRTRRHSANGYVSPEAFEAKQVA